MSRFLYASLRPFILFVFLGYFSFNKNTVTKSKSSLQMGFLQLFLLIKTAYFYFNILYHIFWILLACVWNEDLTVIIPASGLSNTIC